ncbi:MAG: PKD domain-containing protein [Rhodoferax sp.]|nr:PKD domain-containing protein [Rhodoferax sp.]
MNVRTHLAVVFAAGLVLGGAVQAQVLGTLGASTTTIKVGEPVTLTANIDVLSGNYCGFVLGFGDGTFKDAVSDASTPVPLVVTRTYDKPGTYHVTLGGKNVQSHPNCGGPERAVDIVVTGVVSAPVPVTLTAKNACATGWKLSGKLNTKTGAFTCAAKPGKAFPDAKPSCKGDLSYFENVKKGQYGCKP